MKSKYVCKYCLHRLTDDDILRAPHPWIPRDFIMGCPACKSVDSLRAICDAENCWNEASHGAWTRDGYKNLCLNHYDMAVPAAEG